MPTTAAPAREGTREATVTGPKATAIYRRTPAGTYEVDLWRDGRFHNSFAFDIHARRAWEFAGVMAGLIEPGQVADGDDTDED